MEISDLSQDDKMSFFLVFECLLFMYEILQMMLDRSFPITSIKTSFQWCGLFLNFTWRVLNLWSISRKKLRFSQLENKAYFMQRAKVNTTQVPFEA